MIKVKFVSENVIREVFENVEDFKEWVENTILVDSRTMRVVIMDCNLKVEAIITGEGNEVAGQIVEKVMYRDCVNIVIRFYNPKMAA